MDDLRCREFFGSIIKEERVISLNKLNLPNTLVLEAIEPFPGYYGNNPKDDLPRIYFLATEEIYSFENILRISNNIVETKKIYFEATQGSIEINSRKFPVIRIKALDKYYTISELQNLLIEKGIQFRKPIKIEGTGIIKLKKFFYLENLDTDLYYEFDKNDIGYFILPKSLTWEEFKNLTDQVRNNWNIHGFDAAQGTIYRNWEVIDIARIYSKKLSLDFLHSIHEKYMKEISVIS